MLSAGSWTCVEEALIHRSVTLMDVQFHGMTNLSEDSLNCVEVIVSQHRLRPHTDRN